MISWRPTKQLTHPKKIVMKKLNLELNYMKERRKTKVTRCDMIIFLTTIKLLK